MRFKSMSKGLEGTVLEILGTAFSVGCQVDGKSPKDVSDGIKKGEIEGLCIFASFIFEFLWVWCMMLMFLSVVPEE